MAAPPGQLLALQDFNELKVIYEFLYLSICSNVLIFIKGIRIETFQSWSSFNNVNANNGNIGGKYYDIFCTFQNTFFTIVSK